VCGVLQLSLQYSRLADVDVQRFNDKSWDYTVAPPGMAPPVNVVGTKRGRAGASGAATMLGTTAMQVANGAAVFNPMTAMAGGGVPGECRGVAML
jgi:hypothetical protein